ncbi:MAG: class I SAM-dependent methyltransferase [Bacteroidota bacterium]|nr:class I SAM-dependent methyltransferase [Bacteroidota bacterium]
MTKILDKHKEIWEKKKILRIIYKEWYKMIIKNLSSVGGKSLELGAGSGNFKEFMPEVISADIDKCDWLDMSFDAHNIPFDNESLANIIMIDVFHHLYNPVKFLNEAQRVLKRGGRILMLEPFPTAFSSIIYKAFHPEPFIFNIDYYLHNDLKEKDPWDSNQAIPYLIFFKHQDKFLESFGQVFKIIKKEKMSFILYPASGGFENKSMIPDSLISFFKGLETVLTPFKDLLAFRCFVVIEKRSE